MALYLPRLLIRGIASIGSSPLQAMLCDSTENRHDESPMMQRAKVVDRTVMCGVASSCLVHRLNVLFQLVAVGFAITDLAYGVDRVGYSVSQMVVAVIVVVTSAVGAKAWCAIPWSHHKDKLLFMLFSWQAMVALLGYTAQLGQWYMFNGGVHTSFSLYRGTHFRAFSEVAMVAYLVTMMCLLVANFLLHLVLFAFVTLRESRRAARGTTLGEDVDTPAVYPPPYGDVTAVQKEALLDHLDV
jgi:hypothetical protein